MNGPEPTLVALARAHHAHAAMAAVVHSGAVAQPVDAGAEARAAALRGRDGHVAVVAVAEDGVAPEEVVTFNLVAAGPRGPLAVAAFDLPRVACTAFSWLTLEG